MTIEEIINQNYTLVGNGRFLRAEEHDSLVVDRERQLFFWNSKGIFGNSYDWLTKIQGMQPYEANKLLDDQKNISIPTFYSANKKNDITPYPELVETFYTYGKEHRDYWHNVRGYTTETVERFRLGYTGVWYTIPIFIEGTFRNFQCLRYEPKGRKAWYVGMGALPFNFSILKLTDWVVLTEGPVDAIMLRQNDIPAISQTGGAGTWKNEWLPYFMNTKQIYVTYDNDEAGNAGAERALDNLGTRALAYNFWDYKEGFDATDFFKEGGTKDEFLDLIKGKAVNKWAIP